MEMLISEKLLHEQQARRDMETRLVLHIEEKFKGLREQVCRESRARYESVEQLKGCLQNDFPKLQEMIKEETGQRTQGDAALKEKTLEQVGHVDVAV